MSVHKIPKEHMSLEGWTFKGWISGNWQTIKELFKVGLPLILSLPLLQDSPEMIPVVTVLGKFVLDGIHYWIKKR
jgi:hypothetical protein